MNDARPTEEKGRSPSLGGRVEAECDRFEAAWKAGRRPSIEDYLGEVSEAGRTTLLRELLVLEVTYRRRIGERPTPAEYRCRFPGYVAEIDTILGGVPPPRATPPRAGADHDLLFGLLALQNNFIDREALVSAFAAWVADRSRGLGRILLERGALDDETHALLAALAVKHLQMHGGDLGESLAALSSLGSVRDDLERVADPELQTCLTRVRRTDERADPDPAASHARTAGTSTSVGARFRILRLHRTGGLGAVYVARDDELHREVALKEIRDRHDPDSRSRFLQEAEITGRLEHPGIIPVYGLGTYADGRPFYVMRFIKGDDLKDAIAHFHEADIPGRDPGERALALRELLGRFVDVCNAMAYAHSRGILHRDLKPSNIMLGPYGETLVVDWGLAKPVRRLEEPLSTDEGTLRPDSDGSGSSTRPGDTPGTPAYMSPEQAAGDLERLGLHSDVYGLGATLYTLLTGKPPFADRDVGVVLGQVRRGEFSPPRRVKREVDPALEAICLKAMALVPEDRYPTPGALAEDLDRWLAGEPVSAWREPFSIRARRWMRRHRTAVAGAAAAMLAGLIGLAAVATVQARSKSALEATNLKLIATGLAKERALVAAQGEKEKAEEALSQSEESRRRAEAVLGFLKKDVLATARPENQEGGLGVKVTVREALDAAEPGIVAAFQGQPILEADVRDTLGLTYHYLGEAPLAIRQHE